MSQIVNIQNIDPQTFELQTYSVSDTALISNFDVTNTFNYSSSYIEYFVYDLNNNILDSIVDNSFRGFSLLDNQVVLDPQADLEAQGYLEGQYNTVYNFLNPLLSSDVNNRYYIDQISSDRTEIRLNTTQIPNIDVVTSSLALQVQISQSVGIYKDFYLDFGNNQLIIANNILLDNSNTEDPTVLIKLYDPLPSDFDIQSECWVVEQIANSVAYNIDIVEVFTPITDFIQLQGPNTNLNINDQINNSTDYANYSSLTATTSVNNSSSLKYQLNSLLAEKGIEINIDYNYFSNFCNFSSAYTRLENFYYKLSLIEQYSFSSSYTSNTSSYYTSGSQTIWNNKINDIITNFDGYEYFLYFDSGSNSWPKTNSTPPYNNYQTTSPSASAWLNQQLTSASLYDSENNNNLYLSVPSYLREDSANAQYGLFVEMVGQYFDDIWVYIKDVTNKFNADNRLNYGISKDLVAQAIRDLGVKIYQNNFSVDNLYSAFLGLTPSGSLYNIPNITGSLPTPTGLEYINLIVTASNTASLVSTDDVNKETYKRIYHNLPYLLKKKGSYEGLRALITTYGIPETILSISEYGGKDKNPNTWDYFKQIYNYNLITGSGVITTPWTLNSNWDTLNATNTPSTLQFRFQTQGLPTSNIPYSQSLWLIRADGVDDGAGIVLKYTGSGYNTHPVTLNNPSGSPYSGSIVNPYNQYANLVFYPSYNSSNTASIYLPFFDGGWWSVMVTQTGSNYNIYAGNKIYQGFEGNTIGFLSSSSVNYVGGLWESASVTSSFYNVDNEYNANSLTGSLQEIRYYTQPLSVNRFEDYVMNPQSIESEDTPNQLAFRASLGGELYTASLSIHPKVTGSWIATSSFIGGNSSWTSSLTPLFTSNTEYAYYDQPAVGIQNPITDKIKTVTLVTPTGSTLSPYISIQQNPPISQSITRDIDYVEVAFSPQDEINIDIYDQLGYFNIGEYIGDPRLVPTREESYPPLDDLRDAYFEKYTSNYDEWDYIRLIKFFDNSLFKMLQDWVPARTSLATGIVVKQHVLERNKYPVPQADITSSIAFVGSGSTNIPYLTENILITGSSIQMGYIEGSEGGSIRNTTELYTTSSFLLTFGNTKIINLSGSAVYNITFNASSSGTTDPASLILYNNNSTIPSSKQIYLTSSTTSFNYVFSQDVELSGFLTILNNSDSKNITFSNLYITRLPAYYTLIETPSGSVQQLITNEFDFNGELEGTNLVVTDGDLNGDNTFLNYPKTPTNYAPTFYNSNTVAAGTFLLNTVIPEQGQVYLFYDTGSTLFPAD
jgi:hypothetical protein